MRPCRCGNARRAAAPAFPASNAVSAPAIEHIRDVIRDETGQVVQVYNHLIYRFGEPPSVVARTYFDDCHRVAILHADMPPDAVLPDAVLDYLKARFSQIDRLGDGGYATVWSA